MKSIIKLRNKNLLIKSQFSYNNNGCKKNNDNNKTESLNFE